MEIRFTINSIKISVPEGTLIIDAAKSINAAIPTLCHLPGKECYTSCMLCIVEEIASGKLLPSCSTIAATDMVIETDNKRIRTRRREILELLLSEHVGDCESPCLRGCPAQLNIPEMIRYVRRGNWRKAVITVFGRIPLPSSLSRVCPAPCEKNCHRREADDSVSIRQIEQYIGDIASKDNTLLSQPSVSSSGKKVAVVGAGPAGLTACFYLNERGHTVILFEKAQVPGGGLRMAFQERTLPSRLLEQEIGTILERGIIFQGGSSLGENLSLDALAREYDAVLIATGTADDSYLHLSGLKRNSRGIATDTVSLMTDRAGVFACGGAVNPVRMAVRAVAHGQKAALAVDCYVRTGQALTGNQNFNCRVRTFLPSEQKRLLQYASAKGRVFHHVDCKKEYSEEEARSEASRCFDCSCKSAANCSLRVYASEYRAEQKFREPADRRELFTYPGDDSINFEPAKCIRCGRCVRLSGDIANEPGLAFAGKGDEMTVVPALGESLARALTISAQKCVEACPTGALYFNDSISRQIESEQEKNEA